MKWPSANNKSAWSQFDADVSKILETTCRGEVDRQLETMTAIIVIYTTERFGHVKDGKIKSSYTMNRRATKIHQLCQKL